MLLWPHSKRNFGQNCQLEAIPPIRGESHNHITKLNALMLIRLEFCHELDFSSSLLLIVELVKDGANFANPALNVAMLYLLRASMTGTFELFHSVSQLSIKKKHSLWLRNNLF